MDNMKNVLHMDNVTMQFGGVVAVNGPLKVEFNFSLQLMLKL